MRIIDSQGTWTFVPMNPEEERVVAEFVSILKPEEGLDYGGKSRDGEFCTITLYAGAQQKEQTTGNVSRFVYVGGAKLVLQGSTVEDKALIGQIRDVCFFSSGKRIYVGHTQVAGKMALLIAGGRCKECGATMNTRTECEWGVCDECAQQCEHSYARKPVHGGGIDVGMGDVCTQCGRARPKEPGERELTVMEHHLAVERELGVPIFHQTEGGLILNTQEVVTLERLMRRAEKASRRKSASS